MQCVGSRPGMSSKEAAVQRWTAALLVARAGFYISQLIVRMAHCQCYTNMRDIYIL